MGALTRLASFEERSSFRTWLYRITVNHVLNTKRGRLEPESTTFSCYGHGLDGHRHAWFAGMPTSAKAY